MAGGPVATTGAAAAAAAAAPEPRAEQQQDEQVAAAGEDDERRLAALYYQSMFVSHKVPLFTRTHQRMLRALYQPDSPSSAPSASSSSMDVDEAVWRRVAAFLDDHGELMALRVRLLQAQAAQPWLAPPSFALSSSNAQGMKIAAAAAGGGGGGAAAAASAAMDTGGPGGDGLGWRLAGRCLRDARRHERGKYDAACRRHAPLLAAIEGEMARLAAGGPGGGAQGVLLTAGGGGAGEAGSGQAAAAMAVTSSSSMLDRQLRLVDDALLLENKMALWARLRAVVLTATTLPP